MSAELPEIPPEERTPLVLRLLEIIQQQQELLQHLRDEIARLKGLPPRPTIAPPPRPPPAAWRPGPHPRPPRPRGPARPTVPRTPTSSSIPRSPCPSPRPPPGPSAKATRNTSSRNCSSRPA